MASIVINGSRRINLLTSKKNANAKHIVIGSFYGELTTDINQTLGKPTLGFTKDGVKYYIREKFTQTISNRNLGSGYFSKSNSSGVSYKPSSINIPFNIVKGTITLKTSNPWYWGSGSVVIQNVCSLSFSFDGGNENPHHNGSTVSVSNIKKGTYTVKVQMGSSYGACGLDFSIVFNGEVES